MNKAYLLVGAIVAILVAGFGYQSFITMHDGETKAEMESRIMHDADMMKDKQAVMSSTSMEKDMIDDKAKMMEDGVMMGTGTKIIKDDSMMKADAMMVKQGSYVAYDPTKLSMAKEGHVVLFFRAAWCPTCRALDKDIKNNLAAVPVTLTILDVDYDNSTDLKKKYGVTYQHTLVEVDANGNMIKKWAGSPTLAALVSEVK